MASSKYQNASENLTTWLHIGIKKNWEGWHKKILFSSLKETFLRNGTAAYFKRFLLLKNKGMGKKGGARFPVFVCLSSWFSSQLLGKALPLGWVFSQVRSFVGRFVQTRLPLPWGLWSLEKKDILPYFCLRSHDAIPFVCWLILHHGRFQDTLMKFRLDQLLFPGEKEVAACPMHSVLRATINTMTSFWEVWGALELDTFFFSNWF